MLLVSNREARKHAGREFAGAIVDKRGRTEGAVANIDRRADSLNGRNIDGVRHGIDTQGRRVAGREFG